LWEVDVGGSQPSLCKKLETLPEKQLMQKKKSRKYGSSDRKLSYQAQGLQFKTQHYKTNTQTNKTRKIEIYIYKLKSQKNSFNVIMAENFPNLGKLWISKLREHLESQIGKT
jgi:beta-lactam-binding protein with PASTA domain